VNLASSLVWSVQASIKFHVEGLLENGAMHAQLALRKNPGGASHGRWRRVA
jgi:hypothetical protein